MTGIIVILSSADPAQPQLSSAVQYVSK